MAKPNYRIAKILRGSLQYPGLWITWWLLGLGKDNSINYPDTSNAEIIICELETYFRIYFQFKTC